jgi:hypothetical protein
MVDSFLRKYKFLLQQIEVDFNELPAPHVWESILSMKVWALSITSLHKVK